MENERDRAIADLIATWLDSDLADDKRLAAVGALIERFPDIAKPLLLAVAERTVEPRPILEAAGAGLAQIEHGGVSVSQFDMRNMSEVAFLAWDAWRPPP